MDSGQKQHLALRVALDTMKDRCILQQKRLAEIEGENQQLRERVQQVHATTPHHTTHNAAAGGVAETFQLRLQVSELQRLNGQLNAHIDMVSAENRKLWSRLSQIAKDQSAKLKDNDCTLTASDMDSGAGDGSPRGNGLSNQNLIRSKTFTLKTAVNSPNHNLRHKNIPVENCESDMRDISLEDGAALEVYGDGESGNKQTSANDEVVISEVTMGLGFLNVDDTSSTSNSTQEQDFNAETKKCLEGLVVMRQEAMKQQKELNSVFALLESRIALQPCPECVKKSHKPEMADKSLETDESFNDSKYTNITNNYQDQQCDFNESVIKASVSAPSTEQQKPASQINHLNIIQEKILADEVGRICPMCGKLFDCALVPLASFCEHVEEHFRDDSLNLVDNMENNFELISHTVGDF